MLQSIRERTGIGLPLAVLALLVVPFVISSLYGYVGGGGGPQTVASVNGEDISRVELDQAYQRRQAELRQLLGASFDPSIIDANQLRRETLQQLIDRRVMLNYAITEGLQASDADVAIAVRSQPIFQVDGEFSLERYRSILEQNRLTPERYEAQLRQDLSIDLLERSILQTTITSDRELDRILALQNQRRELVWATVPTDAYADSVMVDEQSLRDWYQENASRYQLPEQVRLRYLLLDPAEIAETIEVEADAIEAAYEARAAQVASESDREIRHILIALAPEASAEDDASAREALEAARARITAGETFADVAEDISDDPGSASQGGALGMLRPADLVPAFADAAWALEVGQISDPVRTEFGWHLIEVTDVQAAEMPEFDAIREQLRDEIALERAERELFDLGNQVDQLAFENPTTLEPAARAADLTIQTSDWIAPGGPSAGDDSVLDDPALLEAVFSESSLGARENTDLIELASGAYVVARVDDYRAARIEEFEAVRDDVQAQYQREQAAQAAQQDAQAIAQAIESGDRIDVAAAVFSAAVLETPQWLTRNDRSAPAAVREAGFRLPAPERAASTPVSVVRTPDGWAAVTLLAVEDGDPSAVDQDTRSQLRASVNNLDGQASVDALLAALRERATIRVYEDNL